MGYDPDVGLANRPNEKAYLDRIIRMVERDRTTLRSLSGPVNEAV
jgi:hypothetical protein